MKNDLQGKQPGKGTGSLKAPGFQERGGVTEDEMNVRTQLG